MLYVSLHRYGAGFFPGTGAASDAGVGPGAGYTLNIPWLSGGIGDGDYVTAFQRLVMPICHEFAPELVLVAAGFDSGAGDPLGGCEVRRRSRSRSRSRRSSRSRSRDCSLRAAPSAAAALYPAHPPPHGRPPSQPKHNRATAHHPLPPLR